MVTVAVMTGHLLAISNVCKDWLLVVDINRILSASNLIGLFWNSILLCLEPYFTFVCWIITFISTGVMFLSHSLYDLLFISGF